MFNPNQPFKRDQLVLVVHLVMQAVFDVVQGLLPPVNDRKSCNKNEVEYKGIIHGAKQTVAHFCPFLYAHLTDDGMSIAEFPAWDDFNKRVEQYVSDCLAFDPPSSSPGCEDLAAKFVDGVFAEYLKNTESQFSDVGFELGDGGYIAFPDTDGTIRRRDSNGNCEDVRNPGDDDYNDWRDLFPDDALYYQPDKAGDVGCGTSAEEIRSFQVYRNRGTAEKAHPDCHILTFANDDIQQPKFLDVHNPTYGDPRNKPE